MKEERCSEEIGPAHTLIHVDKKTNKARVHLPRQGEILRASENGHPLALAAAQAHPRPSEHAAAVALKVRCHPPEERQR